MLRVISYGGGVDSTAMTLQLLKDDERPDLIIFADTGAEWPETYKFIDEFDAWLKKFGLEITRIQCKEGPMYEYMLERRWTPSRLYPSHIERWKIRPILQYLKTWRQEQPVEMCIGIDYDEADRMASPRRKYITNRYPLVEAEIGRRGAEALIKEVGLPMPIKSGCFFCPYQLTPRWLRLKREHPDLYLLARRLEENGKFFPKKTLHYSGPLRRIEELIDGNETLDISCKVAGACGR
mgnify:CR=1 FL=1